MRQLTFCQAINDALRELLADDPSVILIGQGVKSPWYVGQTTVGLVDAFGEDRVIDTPVSEGGITGAAVGAALAGLRPIVEHPRMDFMYLAMDQICNHAAPWHYMFGGKTSVPLTIWGIVNRYGEQAAQHSQAMQALFAHVPGLTVVMPSHPYDAKGLLVAAVRDDNPVLFIDERKLYERMGEVPEGLYEVPLGKGVVRRQGRDVTVAATSYMVHEALAAAAVLEREGIDVEVFDPLTVKPLDEEGLLASVRKTGRFVAADGAWRTCGVAAEMAALVAEKAFDALTAPVRRVTLPDLPAPASRVLEEAYYVGADHIAQAVRSVMGR